MIGGLCAPTSIAEFLCMSVDPRRRTTGIREKATLGSTPSGLSTTTGPAPMSISSLASRSVCALSHPRPRASVIPPADRFCTCKKLQSAAWPTRAFSVGRMKSYRQADAYRPNLVADGWTSRERIATSRHLIRGSRAPGGHDHHPRAELASGLLATPSRPARLVQCHGRPVWGFPPRSRSARSGT